MGASKNDFLLDLQNYVFREALIVEKIMDEELGNGGIP